MSQGFHRAMANANVSTYTFKMLRDGLWSQAQGAYCSSFLFCDRVSSLTYVNIAGAEGAIFPVSLAHRLKNSVHTTINDVRLTFRLPPFNVTPSPASAIEIR
jgi:hypothetical protein